MGHSLQINGEIAEYPEDTEIREVKQNAGFLDEDVVMVNDGSDKGWEPVEDDTKVADIPEGSAVTSQPSEGTLFG
jgi:hypothetical protein